MLYESLARRHGLSHGGHIKYFRLIRTLTWVQSIYIFISAIMMGSALVKGEGFFALAALTFLGAAFALKAVRKKLEMTK